MYGSEVGHHREGGCQLPFRRLVEGPRKANSGCLEGLLRVSGGVIASSGKLMCVPRKLANVEGGGQLPSVDHLRVLGRSTQGVWSVTVIARELMCMTIKLANI